MDAVGLPTAGHRQLLIQATGDSTTDVLEEPAPAIKVHELSDSAIEFIVRPWVRTEHYWETYWGLNREIKLRLDHEGIQLGVPRRDVRVRTASRDD